MEQKVDRVVTHERLLQRVLLYEGCESRGRIRIGASSGDDCSREELFTRLFVGQNVQGCRFLERSIRILEAESRCFPWGPPVEYEQEYFGCIDNETEKKVRLVNSLSFCDPNKESPRVVRPGATSFRPGFVRDGCRYQKNIIRIVDDPSECKEFEKYNTYLFLSNIRFTQGLEGKGKEEEEDAKGEEGN